MNEVNSHYRMLLGLDEAWRVKSVDLSMESKRVVIAFEHRGGRLTCPECGISCTRADLAPEGTWRHLDTMQFETILQARTPRCACEKCGVKTVDVPWAGKHSRFTLMFEAFAIRGLKVRSSLKQAAALLQLDWDTAVSFFEQWYEWASTSNLTPMVAKAEMLKRHLPGLLNYFKHRYTYAMSQGFNSKNQQIKSNARGFRSLESYRVRILSYCGKFDLLPRKVRH